jgi:hypothetical protein
VTPPAASTEPAFHALSDRALWHQRAFWAANAGLDTAARAFLTACNREMTRRGLDAGIALMAAAETVAKRTGCTGASATVFFATLLWEEWAEIDLDAAKCFHRAVGTILDPKTSHNKKAWAEQERAKAVRDLFAALDLEMATPEGSG